MGADQPQEADGPPQAPAVEQASGGRRRGRALLVWGVAGAVVLAGAGLVAAKTLRDDKKTATTAVTTTVSPSAPVLPPAPTSLAPPSSAPATGPSSGKPSASGSKSPTQSGSGKPSSGSPTPKTGTDDDGDGISDDPGATDPNQLAAGARTAYQQVKSAMAADGVVLTLTSGKRSYQHQLDLWNKEVADTGSTEAARMRVLPPGESSHVQGIAIDINVAAQPWMKAKGAQYGWCQIYANESWHFEFNASYKTSGCPALKAHP